MSTKSEELRNRYILLIVFSIVVFITSFWSPYANLIVLQHIQTALFLIVYCIVLRTLRVSKVTFLLVMFYLICHALGAFYSYFVPYDNWAQSLVGHSLKSIFNFKRNHYDRFVHLVYGGVFFFVVKELLDQTKLVYAKYTAFFAFQFILASSLVYEMFEWLVAVFLSPLTSSAFNGLQGDIWDSMEDSALSTVGALIPLVVSIVQQSRNAVSYSDMNTQAEGSAEGL